MSGALDLHKDLRVAIVHDWLTVRGGAERVLDRMLRLFPQAHLYSMVDFMSEEDRVFLGGAPVKTSFIQGMPWARRGYRSYLPLMPLAVEQFDLSRYDLVLSSSHSVAKGVITGPDQLHICMCYSPMRYAWDLQNQYLVQTGLHTGLRGVLARWFLHRIRIWDARTANGVDRFLAISRFIARRIWKTYRRESVVVYPPVDMDAFPLREEKDDFFVTASRLVPYKKIDLIAAAFRSMPDRRLVVIGDGPEASRIASQAGGNVTMLGRQAPAALLDHMQRARAFILAAEEDFGIAPVEAQACGTPVIAYGKGGAIETVRGLESPEPTGVFFPEQEPEAVAGAIDLFERERGGITPAACRRNALRFSAPRFDREFSHQVTVALRAWREGN